MSKKEKEIETYRARGRERMKGIKGMRVREKDIKREMEGER